VSLQDDLVDANRILYAHRVVDAFGHVSVRDEADPSAFFLARNLAPSLVRATDVMRFALDGNPRDGDVRTPYLERFIHGSIYRARPDVGAVVHSHAPSVIPFGVVREAPLRPLWHMSAFLGEDVPVFEIRDALGEASDLLVRDHATGDALARALGGANAVLMRGHGATVVGRDVREAVFRAVYLALNAQLQADAMRLGTVAYLSPGEAEAATRSIATQIERAWSLWTAEEVS
jgi:ribulose-5-phosphate 4-epimerase/fuculose-1-phosphate aldolase